MKMVEITEINISDDKIEIIATNLEDLLMAEDLFEDVEPEELHYSFDRHARNGAEMKYLYKVVSSQKRCASARSMGSKLEKLAGAILTISDNFLDKE